MEEQRLHISINSKTASLYEEVVSGSYVAFETVHNMYKARLSYYVKKMLDDWQDVEDIVSETFLSLWKSRESIQSDLHLKNFLYVTVRNNALNLIATKKRQIKARDELLEINVFENQDQNPDVVETELLYLLERAIETLPKECRRIFELAYHDQLSPKEIAEVLSINPATVRSQKRTAIDRIKEWISKNAPQLLVLITALLERI